MQNMELSKWANNMESLPEQDRMPALFIGHGNPMNAILDNEYHRSWQALGNKLPMPKAILCISAHWLTKGTAVTMSKAPVTIHDFGGFPDELFQQQYPAPGAPEQAQDTIDNIKYINIMKDNEWGLDHGAWSILMAMYPKANIPVYQLSLDYGKPMTFHFELAKQLSFLRKKGVLIVGSGNVVHNLGMLKFDNSAPFDWALEFDDFVKQSILNDEPKVLVDFQKMGKLSTLAHPSYDHYLPLIYSLALRGKNENVEFFNESFDLGSISMRSVLISN